MAYNGSGTFLINTAGQPVVAGTVISSTTFNALTADLATGLSTVITKDGQTTVTANIPMASFKFTGLGVGSAAGDSANLSQVQSTVTKLLASVSGADTVTATASPTLAAYAAGQMFYFVAAGDNTTSVTLNIDALGAKAVTRDGSVALAAADIKSGEVVVVVYDGTRFQVVSQLNSAGNATFANVSITSALNVGGIATFSAGSAAAPSITTTGDTNTGIYFPAADTIAFTEGGVESMRIDSSGNVGINTASPTSKLHVDGGSIAPTSGQVARFDTSATTAYNGAAFVGGTLRLNYGNATSSYGGINFSNFGATNQDFFGVVQNSSGYGNFVWQGFNGSYGERMRLDSSGNLGLGVTPSTWTTFTSALEVPGGALAGISANQVGIWQNCFYNSSSFKYKSTAAATFYQLASGIHAWNTAPSGTAGDTISFTTAMTLDAAGRLLVGATAATAIDERLNVTGRGIVTQSAANTNRALIGTFGGSEFVVGTFDNFVMTFRTNNTERARITAAGDWIVGSTTIPDGTNTAMAWSTSGDTSLLVGGSGTGGNQQIGFINGNGAVGSITTTGSSTAYNTSSDVRLKKNIVDAQDSSADVDALQVRSFDWKSDNTHQRYGFIAQELVTVAPEAVHQPTDTEKMMGVDYSKLVPMLVKEVQSLRKRVAELESK